jgi:hypothetical protein
VALLEGGLPAWKAAGLDVDESAASSDTLAAATAAARAANSSSSTKYKATLIKEKVRCCCCSKAALNIRVHALVSRYEHPLSRVLIVSANSKQRNGSFLSIPTDAVHREASLPVCAPSEPQCGASQSIGLVHTCVAALAR